MNRFLHILEQFLRNVTEDYYSTAAYHSFEIPLGVELELAESWPVYEELSTEERGSLRKHLTLSLAALMTTYSVRMATLAVRNRDERLVYFGCLGLTVDDHLLDERDISCVCCVLYDAAYRIGIDPGTPLEKATKFAAGRRLVTLKYYLDGAPDYMKSLSSMGFATSGSGGDFYYRES